MEKEVKVRILDMTYDKDNHLFQMRIEELVGEKKQTVLAINADDFGIKKEWPIGAIQEFCQLMKGQEKMLHIVRDPTSMANAERDEEGKMPEKEMDRIFRNLDSYPIDAVYTKVKGKQNED